MPVRSTTQTSPASHTLHVASRSTARRVRIGMAALAASLAIAGGAVLATDGGESAGSSPQSGPAAASVAERPDIDARHAAEKFHHRR